VPQHPLKEEVDEGNVGAAGHIRGAGAAGKQAGEPALAINGTVSESPGREEEPTWCHETRWQPLWAFDCALPAR